MRFAHRGIKPFDKIKELLYIIKSHGVRLNEDLKYIEISDECEIYYNVEGATCI